MQNNDIAHAFLLLTLPDVSVKQVYEGEEMTLASGELSLECVSLPIPPDIGHQTANPFTPGDTETHDLWLVVKVGDFEHTLVPGNYLTARAPPGGDGGPAYSISDGTIPNARVDLVLEAPRNAAELEDLSTFESLLRQYGSIHPEESALTGILSPTLSNTPAPKYDGPASSAYGDEKSSAPQAPPIVMGAAAENLRGRLVLVDEETGQVLGELEGQPSKADIQTLDASDPTRPVVIDLAEGADGYASNTIQVSSIPPELLDDWLLRGADRVSRGILSFGTWGSQKMMEGADKYRQKTTPRPEPLKLGSYTNSGIKGAHAVSGTAQAVTSTTVNAINSALLRLTGSSSSSGTKGKAAALLSSHSGATTPTTGQSKKQGYYAMFKDSANQIVTAVRTGTPSSSAPTSATATSAPSLAAGEKAPPSYTQADVYPEKTAAYGAIQTATTGVASPTVASGKGAAGVPSPATAYGKSAAAAGPSTLPPGAKTSGKKFSLMNRSIIAVDAVLNAAEQAANTLVMGGTAAASSAVGHKYGNEAGTATQLAGATVRNVVLVYVDVRGVGRRSLLKRATKGFVKARLRNGDTVRIQSQQASGPRTSVVDHELVVSVPEVQEKKR